MMVADATQERMLAWLRRHGWNATSFQVLEPGFSYWFDPDDRGCVAYVETPGAWVAAGAPIAAVADLAAVAHRFVGAARRAGRRASFFGSEERFVERSGFQPLLIGEQPVWDPRAWAETVRGSKSLREQLRRARAKGVMVARVASDEAAGGLRAEIEALAEQWLRGKTMAPMAFLVQLQLFAFAGERRFWVARREGRVVALLAAIPVYERRGWFFEDLLRGASAPNGTAELLIDAALRELADEGCDYATLGLAPLSGALQPWMRAARDLGAPLYDFEGLRAFKERLRPARWDPVYLTVPPGRVPSVALFDSLRAFAQGGLLRFGVRTLLRGPSVVVRVLAALLVPWTLALAFVASDHWFPAPWVRWAWVAFDVGLFAGLWSLTHRWRPRLATWLAALVTADAVVTLAEAVAFNVPRASGWLDWIVMVTAVLAPSLAAALLWAGRAHRRRGQAASPTQRAG